MYHAKLMARRDHFSQLSSIMKYLKWYSISNQFSSWFVSHLCDVRSFISIDWLSIRVPLSKWTSICGGQSKFFILPARLKLMLEKKACSYWTKCNVLLAKSIFYLLFINSSRDSHIVNIRHIPYHSKCMFEQIGWVKDEQVMSLAMVFSSVHINFHLNYYFMQLKLDQRHLILVWRTMLWQYERRLEQRAFRVAFAPEEIVNLMSYSSVLNLHAAQSGIVFFRSIVRYSSFIIIQAPKSNLQWIRANKQDSDM